LRYGHYDKHSGPVLHFSWANFGKLDKVHPEHGPWAGWSAAAMVAERLV
jgi:hypothetical protein